MNIYGWRERVSVQGLCVVTECRYKGVVLVGVRSGKGIQKAKITEKREGKKKKEKEKKVEKSRKGQLDRQRVEKRKI